MAPRGQSCRHSKRQVLLCAAYVLMQVSPGLFASNTRLSIDRQGAGITTTLGKPLTQECPVLQSAQCCSYQTPSASNRVHSGLQLHAPSVPRVPTLPRPLFPAVSLPSIAVHQSIWSRLLPYLGHLPKTMSSVWSRLPYLESATVSGVG